MNVPDTAAGKGIRCPKCQHEFRAPVTGSNAAPSNVGQQAPPVPEPSPALDQLAAASTRSSTAPQSGPTPRSAMKANASQFWRKYLWLWLLTAGLLLGWATGLFEDDKTEQPQPVRKDKPGHGPDSNLGTKGSKEDVSFLKALPGILTGGRSECGNSPGVSGKVRCLPQCPQHREMPT